jgi:hypothetical protein
VHALKGRSLQENQGDNKKRKTRKDKKTVAANLKEKYHPLR